MARAPSRAGPVEQVALQRSIGLGDSILLVVGIIIGSGIFLTTGVVADRLPSPWLILAAWLAGGILTLAGAITCAELAAAMPEAGGMYVYLREAYGRFPAFLFGWISLLAYQTGAIASVAVGFATYLAYLIFPASTTLAITTHLRIPIVPTIAVLLIGVLTAVNVQGLRLGTLVQNVSTVGKLLGIVSLAGLGVFATISRVGQMPPLWSQPPTGASGLLLGFGGALVAILWAYDGWGNLSFSAGEVRSPGTTLPRAFMLGVALVTLVYIAVNLFYVLALPMSELRGIVRVADAAAARVLPPGASVLVVAAVLVSTFGATNGTILTSARVSYAMARDGLFFSPVARLHPAHRTPHVALWLQGTWAGVLALTGSFEQLFTFTMVAALLLYAASAASVFTLRRIRPTMERPYRAWGYPWVPAAYIASLLLLLVAALIEEPIASLGGLGAALSGIPVYLYWAAPRRRAADVSDGP